MAVPVNEFDPKRALAALMYLVRESSSNLYTLMKMIYVADKIHLRLSGRYMANDDYVAMEQGATPSGAYDLVKYVRGNHQLHRGLPEAQQYFRVIDNTEIELTADVPEDDISQIARQCLDEVIGLYRQHPNWVYWYRQAHDAAWQESLRENALAPQMDILDVAKTTPDNESLLDYLSDPYPEAAES
jgi:hypothetical protein